MLIRMYLPFNRIMLVSVITIWRKLPKECLTKLLTEYGYVNSVNARDDETFSTTDIDGNHDIDPVESTQILQFLAATKQLYKWYFPSVCPSVRLSVCLSVTPFWLCSHHRIIIKFSGVITNDQSKVHAKGQGQRSKVRSQRSQPNLTVSGL